jgi:nanoRNase/pAp phosphatase (c-di-AMP/oligoRNAs hydrolase)
MYLVLGLGTVGFAIASALKERGETVTIIEKDASRVKELKEKGFAVIEGDFFSAASAVRRAFEAASVVFILSGKSEVNNKLLTYVYDVNPYAFIVVRATRPKDVKELKSRGAGAVITPQTAMAEIALQKLHSIERIDRARRLKQGLKRGERLGIIMHDNPDPDAIASAMALQKIADKQGVSSDILYGGNIGHQQNKVFVNLLGIELLRIDEYNKYLLRGYDRLAFVDLSSDANTSILPSDITPDIIIDHHPKSADYSLSVEDVRTHIGAVSTMLTEYIVDFDIELDELLATALLYGIMTDTNNFRRRISREDVEAVAWLQTKVDQEMLSKIENPTISSEVLDVIGKAVLGREVVSGYVVSNVGYISNRDSLPQAAEFLLNLEGVSTVLVFGVLNDSLYISARTKDIKLHLGQTMEEAFGTIGSAGGHVSSAGARIPLGIFGMIDDKEILKSLAGEAIKKMFLKAVDVY